MEASHAISNVTISSKRVDGRPEGSGLVLGSVLRLYVLAGCTLETYRLNNEI